MTSKQDGGSAFPVHETIATGGVVLSESGMSLRDYFAAKAMHAALVTAKPEPGRSFDELLENAAFVAYKSADALLKARGE